MKSVQTVKLEQNMQANKTSKPFMSYEEQLALLKSKCLDITDETYTMNLLKRYSYFALISGYKNPFKSKKNDKYKFGTSIDDIFSLYQFDFRLRALFQKNILIVETHICMAYTKNAECFI